MLDLRSYIGTLGPALFEPTGQLSVVQEITALQHVLSKSRNYPVIHVREPRLADGRASTFGVVTNLCASRMLMGAKAEGGVAR